MSTKMVSSLELIRRVTLFSKLTPSQAEFVASAVVKRRLKKGDFIVEQGQKSGALSIILTGRAHVLATDEQGRSVILATMGPGDYVGEMSLIDDEPHSASVQADITTDVLILGQAEFARCLPENSSMAYAVMKGLVQRLRQADRKIESLALMDVYGRVAHALLEVSSPDDEGNSVIRERVSRLDISKMVGASREMVSRVIKDLEVRGLVETREDGSMVVKDGPAPASVE